MSYQYLRAGIDLYQKLRSRFNLYPLYPNPQYAVSPIIHPITNIDELLEEIKQETVDITIAAGTADGWQKVKEVDEGTELKLLLLKVQVVSGDGSYSGFAYFFPKSSNPANLFDWGTTTGVKVENNFNMFFVPAKTQLKLYTKTATATADTKYRINLAYALRYVVK